MKSQDRTHTRLFSWSSLVWDVGQCDFLLRGFAQVHLVPGWDHRGLGEAALDSFLVAPRNRLSWGHTGPAEGAACLSGGQVSAEPLCC